MHALPFALAFMIALFVIGLFILFIASFWNVFQKSGQKGWYCLIPIYNFWILAKIGGLAGWWGLLASLSYFGNFNKNMSILFWLFYIISIFAYLMISMGVARKFGKGRIFAFFALWLIPIIGYPILGFGKAKYIKNN